MKEGMGSRRRSSTAIAHDLVASLVPQCADLRFEPAPCLPSLLDLVTEPSPFNVGALAKLALPSFARLRTPPFAIAAREELVALELHASHLLLQLLGALLDLRQALLCRSDHIAEHVVFLMSHAQEVFVCSTRGLFGVQLLLQGVCMNVCARERQQVQV